MNNQVIITIVSQGRQVEYPFNPGESATIDLDNKKILIAEDIFGDPEVPLTAETETTKIAGNELVCNTDRPADAVTVKVPLKEISPLGDTSVLKRMILEGRDTKEISSVLGIKQQTVYQARYNMRKDGELEGAK